MSLRSRNYGIDGETKEFIDTFINDPRVAHMGFSRRQMVLIAFNNLDLDNCNLLLPAKKRAVSREERFNKEKEQEALTESKSSEEQAPLTGMGICEALGGIVEGDMCQWDKYERMSNGRKVQVRTGKRIALLTQNDIDAQYSPSKEAYEAE